MRNEGNESEAEDNTINDMNVDTDGHAYTEINTVPHIVRRKELL